jgi:hypothetical protein
VTDSETLRELMVEGRVMDVRAKGFLDRNIGEDNWHQETLPLAEWAEAESAMSNVRPGAVKGALPEAIQLYVDLYHAGGAPPPVIAHRANGTFRTIDGFQRCTAARRTGQESIVGYVVDLDEEAPGNRETLDFLAMTANDDINGFRSSEADKRAQVLHCLATYPHLPNKEIARRLRISESRVSDIKMIDRARRRADALQANYQEVDPTVLKSLGSIPDDKVFVDALAVAREKNLTTVQALDLAGQVKAQPSEESRLAKVKEFAASPAIAAQTNRRRNGATGRDAGEGASTRRAPRPYWERLLDTAGSLNQRIASAPPAPDQYQALLKIVATIVANTQQRTGRAVPVVVPANGRA